MGDDDDERCLFPLTSLQIGDLQSYLSHLSLFLGLESKKIYILVDNRPWLKDLGARPAHLWQFMVTKSRLSPFANTKGRSRERKLGKESSSKPNTTKSKNLERWFSLIDASTLSRGRVLLPVKNLKNSLLLSNELHRTLYGFIVFEVTWSNVRGINYLNELQTDTSLAIEAKFMKRWEFDSIAQAAGCISSWFSGTLSEQHRLKEYLDSTNGEVFYDAEEHFPQTIPIGDDDDEENVGSDSLNFMESSPCGSHSSFRVYPVMEDETDLLHTPPPTGPYKRRKVTKAINNGVEVDVYCEERQSQVEDTLNCSDTDEPEIAVEPTKYQDILILFRFNDRDLPFKLKQIIMSDLRLLTLLEAGLPSWVLFLQSYPGFCHIYRPWMCPLARALYVLISAVTVIIGFYDLYKNVPVLKATASRLCGPLFDWIETWEMVSRIKYLGTMLFLHNFQKALKWLLMVTHTTRSFFSFLVLPLREPLMELLQFLVPLWTVLSKTAESAFSVIFIVIESSCNLVGDLVNIILLPMWFIVTTIWKIAISIIYPIFWIILETLYAPIRLVLAFANSVAFVFAFVFDLLGDVWRSLSSIFQLASATEATVSSYEISMWRSLWNDLFSQVFRAVRSILNGFVAFFTACNRHRLSIYNHIKDFMRRLDRDAQSQTADGRCSRLTAERQYVLERRGAVYGR